MGFHRDQRLETTWAIPLQKMNICIQIDKKEYKVIILINYCLYR